MAVPLSKSNPQFGTEYSLMKTTFILIGLLLLARIGVGQPYQSIFSADTTRWNVFECAPDAGGTIVYYSFSDTLIQENVYHIMYREAIFSESQELRFENELCGYVREDTLTGKYWFLKFEQGAPQEALFMDLSLNTGDTMAIVEDFRYMWTDSVIVDSVYYVNGRKNVAIAKMHSDCYGGGKIAFIEGVGATNGFYMGEESEQADPYTLMCKFENEIQTYSANNVRFRNCFHSGGAGIHDSGLGRNISIYPNPSPGRISIEVDNLGSDLEYAIYNSHGQLMTQGTLFENLNELDLNSNGVYFIQISNGAVHTTTKVIICNP